MRSISASSVPARIPNLLRLVKRPGTIAFVT
jgi:hypothetical protein